MSAMGVIMFNFILAVSLVTMPGYTHTLDGERGKRGKRQEARGRKCACRSRVTSRKRRVCSQVNLYIKSTKEGTEPSIVNCRCCVSFFSSCVLYGISLSLAIIHNALMDLTILTLKMKKWSSQFISDLFHISLTILTSFSNFAWSCIWDFNVDWDESSWSNDWPNWPATMQ